MTNPTAGHTSASGMGANAQGLRDGDGLTSPSLTNIYEAIHGNGIMRLGDGARGDSLRNSIIPNTPGYIEVGASQGEIKVYGGYCVLDGVMYKFANGPGSSESFIIGTTGAGANHSGNLPSVPSSNSDVFVVVYLVGRNTPEAHLMYEMGTPVSPSSGVPLIPNRFLSNPSITGNTDSNHQHTVLGVLRYTMTGGAGSVTTSLSATPVIHDRRAYLRSTPLYLTPMTKGSIGNVDPANAVTDLDGFFSSPEDGDLNGSTFGAIWQSHREDESGSKHANIYASLPRNLNTTPVTNTYVIGPNRLEVITTTGNLTFTFDQADLWVITTDANRTINPTGNFGIGHVVQIYHTAGAHTLHFDSTVGGHSVTPINVNVSVGEFASFVYDGTNWQQISSAAGVSASSSGASGLVQLSDGAGGFTSDTDLSWDAAGGELTVNGKLTVTGLIDPTGLELDPQGANPGGVAANTLWLDSGASNRPKIGSNAVIRASDNISELTNDSVFVDAAGAASAAPVQSVNSATGAVVLDADDLADGATNVMMTSTERTKLSGIATGAEVNVNADWNAVSGDAQILNKPTDVTDLSTHSVTELSDVTNAGSGDISQGDTAYGWGDHAAAGYLTSFTETDPVVAAINGIVKSNGSVISAAVEDIDYQGVLAEGAFVDGDKTKLDGIATGATAYADADAVAAINAASAIDLTGALTAPSIKSLRLPTVPISTSTNLTAASHAGRYLICTANVTLPATPTAGDHYTILNTSGGGATITITPNGTDTINGVNAAVTVNDYNGATCIALTTTTWIVLGV
jgi:hypothetical protein